MPQVSAADIARVMPLDFSDLLNQRDDTALRPGSLMLANALDRATPSRSHVGRFASSRIHPDFRQPRRRPPRRCGPNAAHRRGADL
jgi:hypothetical protein